MACCTITDRPALHALLLRVETFTVADWATVLEDCAAESVTLDGDHWRALEPGELREFAVEHAPSFAEPFVVVEALDWLDALIGHRHRRTPA